MGDGVILKTSDGGKTWNEQYRESGNFLFEISAVDADNAKICAESGFLKTTDGGSTWDKWDSGLSPAAYDRSVIVGEYVSLKGSTGNIYVTQDERRIKRAVLPIYSPSIDQGTGKTTCIAQEFVITRVWEQNP